MAYHLVENVKREIVMASINDLKIFPSLFGNHIFATLGKFHNRGKGLAVVEAEKKDITNDCFLGVATIMKEQLKRDLEEKTTFKTKIIQYHIQGIGYLQFSEGRPYHKDGEVYTEWDMKLKK